jgi:hypothetical protein
MTNPIIDRDIDFYLASLETETRILRSCRGAKDEDIASACFCAARDVLHALRRYRGALEAAGRIDGDENLT